ncbi:MAG: DUF4272 domain-containing protein [Candidatus Pedobacter colombiensis]|uniref:DUF4272 domain-containing protein n=1 Tax=Candidatus Pedobacter colombiensis TaxID=3121371 RepID=A0AAJ5WAE0_9SPHI|nr:DUF4272 domain-containing protein [Pedobacter sp.]WEK20705.1 MAG: DUF4272 domain-containing protein [Pedobacter sp.]
MSQLKSKSQTEILLTSLNIPFYNRFSLIEDEQKSEIRSPQDIAKRVLILTYLCYIAKVEEDRFEIIEFLKKENLWNSVTNDEQKLFLKEKLTEKEKINISWRSEGIWLLLFTMNKIEKLELPQQEIEMDSIFDKIPDFMTETKEFIKSAVIRPPAEILDLSDLIYRIHWALRNVELNNLAPLDVNPSIVFERHYAVNWVADSSLNWDDITTDT